MCSFRPYGSNLLRKGHGTDLVQFTHIPFNLARRVRALTDDNMKCIEEMNALAQKLSNSNFPLGMVRTAIK